MLVDRALWTSSSDNWVEKGFDGGRTVQKISEKAGEERYKGLL
jgi:hypothetical protein